MCSECVVAFDRSASDCSDLEILGPSHRRCHTQASTPSSNASLTSHQYYCSCKFGTVCHTQSQWLHTHSEILCIYIYTHTYSIDIYIYIYLCVCVCIYIYQKTSQMHGRAGGLALQMAEMLEHIRTLKNESHPKRTCGQVLTDKLCATV